jgi:L-fuculose-phosphate aldolase
MLLAEERRDLTRTGRYLAARSLVIGTSGNLSVRRGDLVAVTPTGGKLGNLTAEQLTVIDLAGSVVDGGLAPTSEMPMHLAIYRDTGARAIVHTHAITTTAIGLVADEIPLVHYAMLTLGGSVRVAPYARYGTSKLAALVVDALQGKQAALLRNHGSIAIGSSLAKATENLELLEWAAQVYHQALLASAVTGKAPRELTQREQEDVVRAMLSSGYGAVRGIEDQGA